MGTGEGRLDCWLICWFDFAMDTYSSTNSCLSFLFLKSLPVLTIAFSQSIILSAFWFGTFTIERRFLMVACPFVLDSSKPV